MYPLFQDARRAFGASRGKGKRGIAAGIVAVIIAGRSRKSREARSRLLAVCYSLLRAKMLARSRGTTIEDLIWPLSGRINPAFNSEFDVTTFRVQTTRNVLESRNFQNRYVSAHWSFPRSSRSRTRSRSSREPSNRPAGITSPAVP
jgi:hypothetical protein